MSGRSIAKPDEQSTQRLMPYAVGLTYAPANGVRALVTLLFLREGTVMAQPFDASGWRSRGTAMPVARSRLLSDSAFFSVSANGILVFRTADTDFQVSWFDRQGQLSGRASEPGGFRGAALSPDGDARRRVAHEPAGRIEGRFVAARSPARGGAPHASHLGGGKAEFPVWSPDGQRIAFTFNNSSSTRSSPAAKVTRRLLRPIGEFRPHLGDRLVA